MNKINDHDLFFEAIDKIYSSKNNLLFLSKSVLSKIEDNFLKKNNERIIFDKDIWYENEKLKNDYKYICDQCEFILKELRTFLNNHHNKNYSERFWKILIGFSKFFFSLRSKSFPTFFEKKRRGSLHSNRFLFII